MNSKITTHYKAEVELIEPYFGKSEKRYFFGSMAEVIGLSAKGSGYLLWLDNGDKIEVPKYHKLTVIGVI